MATIFCALYIYILMVSIFTIHPSIEFEFTEKERCQNITIENKQKLSREDALQDLLICSTKYDPKVPPTYDQRNESATKVSVQFYILSIYSIDETSMEFSVDMFLRQTWLDPRLKYNHSHIDKLELDNKMMEQVWVPDTYFSNEKEAEFHDVTMPNKLMFIYRDGTVKYSIRISMTLSCNMTLFKYPLDSQACPMRIESYAYTTNILKLKWHDMAVIIPEYIGLPQFYFSEIPTYKTCDNGYGTDENFACLETILHLKRNNGYYIIQIFVPSILVVILSWVSFWIDIEAVPARISLGLMAVLTMTTHMSGVRATLPRVSYIKAIDIWMATCITFVFGSLLEYAYINVLNRRWLKPERPTTTILNEVASPIIVYRNFRDRARKADKFSRKAFPGSFGLFNLFFWTFFLYFPDHSAN